MLRKHFTASKIAILHDLRKNTAVVEMSKQNKIEDKRTTAKITSSIHLALKKICSKSDLVLNTVNSL